jgi:HNH endonuclease
MREESGLLTCIYCKSQKFKSRKGSKEHVILSSLGGKKKSRNICCQKCNNDLGKEIDEELSIALSFLSTMLNVANDGRNESAPVYQKAASYKDLSYDIQPGGSFKLSEPKIKFTDKKDKVVSMIVKDKEDANKLIEQFKKGSYIENSDKVEVISVRSYLPELHQRLSIGGAKQLRSITKMMLTYVATLIDPERLRNGCFDSVIDYIKGSNSEYDEIKHDSVTHFPMEPNIDDVNHRVFFITSKDLKLAVGMIEMFGNLRFSTILSRCWDGPSLFKCYAVNPITGEDLNLELTPSDDIFAFLDNRGTNLESYKNQICRIVEIFQDRQRKAAQDKIIQEVCYKYLGKKAEVMSENTHENFISELSWELTKFICRIDSSENITLET